jgi:hypothetical protein
LPAGTLLRSAVMRPWITYAVQLIWALSR